MVEDAEKIEEQKPTRPIKFPVLIESYLRSSRVEKEDINPLIEDVLKNHLNYIPSFKVRLNELEEKHVKNHKRFWVRKLNELKAKHSNY